MRCPQHAATSRRGFTMVELMVVILIIAILTALLVPAIAAAVTAAKNAQVAAEEQNLQTALADFKNKYGSYPPSRIILYNLVAGTTTGAATYGNTTNPAGWPASDINIGDLNQRTVQAMRKFFPRASAYFPTSGTASASVSWSQSANATANGYVILGGDECLAFFLGGMPSYVGVSASHVGASMAVNGFNRDPANPFVLGTNSRTVPLFEFAPQRLVDLDGDGFPSYVDPLSANSVVSGLRPYAYYSAYGNNGYDPNDYDWYDHSTSTPTPELDDFGNPVSRPFYVNFAVHGGGRVTTSVAPNPYTVGDADPVTNVNPTPQNTNFASPQTFQLISAGRDGLWGLGGPYDANSTSTRLPIFTSTNDQQSYQVIRSRERDNITNFAGGKLD